MMSIDNVIGVVGAAKGHLELVIVGMLITVPLLIYGSRLLARIINKYPIILWAGGSLLAWVAAEMVTAEPLLQPYITGYERLIEIAGVILVVAAALIWKRRRKATAPDEEA